MSQPLTVKLNEVGFTKEFKRLEKAFTELQKESRRDIRTILIQQARLFCVDLIFVTQPWGKGSKSKKTGENAVRRDLKRVYMTAADIYKAVSFKSQEQAAAFYGFMKRGTKRDLARAKGILKSLEVNFDYDDFDDGQYHKSRRNSRGRVPRSTRPKLIDDVNALKKYTREIVKRVGFAKGGFADAAIALGRMPGNNGNTRGIPAWVKRHADKQNLGTAYTQTISGTETVVIVNNVRYIRSLVGKAQILSAMNSRARSIERLTRQVIKINAQDSIRKKLMTGMTAGV